MGCKCGSTRYINEKQLENLKRYVQEALVKNKEKNVDKEKNNQAKNNQ